MIIRNKGQDRLPQAPRAPLPELAEFLAPLRVHFKQGPSAETLRQYITGLLSEHPNKNCDTLPEIVPETNEQQFNHLFLANDNFSNLLLQCLHRVLKTAEVRSLLEYAFFHVN